MHNRLSFFAAFSVATLIVFLAICQAGHAVQEDVAAAVAALQESTQPEPIDFAHDVLPILKSRCARCHTGGKHEGSFSLDSRAAMLEFDAVIPGRGAESRMIERILSDDADVRMPALGDPLTDEQISVLRRWVDEGAKWEQGITLSGFRREVLKPLRDVPMPENASGANANPIDLLLRTYYHEQQVAPLEPADGATFARRAYLDLTGLLPPADQLRGFLEDSSLDKRNRLIDDLLNRDVQTAEHWLTFWNDVLRNDYAGTGYIDGGRKQITSWLYASLRDNKPYDQFVRELISPTEESAGFIHGIKWRGRVNASQAPELQFAQNVAQVFLGVNLKCASCHDSFINEWKLADSYGLAAIVSDEPLEMFRCDIPTGIVASPKSLFGEDGEFDASAPKEQRLETLASLFTGQQQSRLARTIVNRLWQRMMGRGLVEPVDVLAGEPWSADVLDYLAKDLVDHGYDLRRTLGLIAASDAYQAKSIPLEESPTTDFVFRGPLYKRMTAEQFVDAVWRITGTTPSKTAASFPNRGGEPVRASLAKSDLLMRALGRPNREQVTTTRPQELTTLEALDLSNGQILAGLLERGASNLLGAAESSDSEAQPATALRAVGCVETQAINSADQIIRRVYVEALSREPTEAESQFAGELLGQTPTQESVADLLWAVFMLPEFQLIR